MNRWGITLPLVGVPRPATRRIVEELAALGYADVWTSGLTTLVIEVVNPGGNEEQIVRSLAPTR